MGCFIKKTANLNEAVTAGPNLILTTVHIRTLTEGRPCKIKTQGNLIIYEPEREALEDTNCDDTLMLDLKPPEL